MKFCFSILLVLILVEVCTGGKRPRYMHLIRDTPLTTTTTPTPSSSSTMFDSAQTQTRAVAGMCGSSENSIASMSAASQSGISSAETCAAYAKDLNNSGARFKAAYISYTKSGDRCAWFTDCGCLASSSTCPGGDQWVSVSVKDVFVDGPVAIVTVEQPSPPKSAQLSSNATAGTFDTAQCDESSTDLMKTFQTQCAMTQNITLARMVAGIIIAIVLVIVGGVYGVAFWLDGEEQKKLVGAAAR